MHYISATGVGLFAPAATVRNNITSRQSGHLDKLKVTEWNPGKSSGPQEVKSRRKIQAFSFNFWISLWTSFHMWPWRVRFSLQKGQVRTAPSNSSSNGYSFCRPQTGQEKGSLFFIRRFLVYLCVDEEAFDKSGVVLLLR